MKNHLNTLIPYLLQDPKPEISALHMDGGVLITQVFHAGTREEIRINSWFAFDMQTALELLQQKGFPTSENLILKAFVHEDTFEALVPACRAHDYSLVAEILIQHRGRLLGEGLGIL